MKILLIIPPYVIEGGTGLPPSTAMLPVGPLSVASLLLEAGLQVDVLDLVFESDWRTTLNKLNSGYDRILISCHTARNISVVKAIISELGLCSWIGLGGNVCLRLGRAEFERLGIKADAVFRGYGHGDAVRNAILLGTQGDIFSQAHSTLPIPTIGLLMAETLEKYRKASVSRYPILGPGGFGCAWECLNCDAEMGARASHRAFDNLLVEIEQAKALGYNHLWCVDNIVTRDPAKMHEFDSEVLRRGMTWSGMTRPELIYPALKLDQLQALKEIAIGIESTNISELNLLNRGVRSNYLTVGVSACKIINEAGVASSGFAMLDMPGSGEEEFWALYRLLKAAQPSTISWSFFNPPVATLLEGKVRSEEFGFYRWPFGLSKVSKMRTVQLAMVLSGIWWEPHWTLNEIDPFFEDDDCFGVRFEEGFLFQNKNARSAIGDIYEIWQKETT